MYIVLRFHVHRIALSADIEKAFLMVSISLEDCDVLRFLWIDYLLKENPCLVHMWFNRVVFGVSSSPFLLNATIKHHLEKYRKVNPEPVELMLRSIYVDDVIFGASDEESAFTLYIQNQGLCLLMEGSIYGDL